MAKRSVPGLSSSGSRFEHIWLALMDAMLITLFSYASLVKLLSFDTFRAQLLVQPLPHFVAVLLAYLLPLLELSAAALLLFSRTHTAAAWLSLGLMTLFTGYAALAVLGFWNRTPCACGGILGRLSWGPHLVFNVFFLALTIVIICTPQEERRAGDNIP